MKAESILVALSGGVDSSVAAARLVSEGHRVIAVTMRTFCYGQEDESAKSCCGLEGIADARSVAVSLGIPHHVVDVAKEFDEHVIQDFVREYSMGRTPNPCIRCNTYVKFPALLARFRALGIDAIATGHHAQLEFGKGPVPRLLRGADASKDQSYVLWGLPPEFLPRVRLPIGHMSKGEVREEARLLGLTTADKAESQDICFVPNGKHAEFVAARNPDAVRLGAIEDSSGQRLGTHRGAAAYTVGQRKGIGVASTEPLYVRAIDAERNVVTVDYLAGLRVDACELDLVNVLVGEECLGGDELLLAQFRVHQDPLPVRVEWIGGRVRLHIPDGATGIAPGQSAVVYRGDQVLMGGVVRSTDRREP